MAGGSLANIPNISVTGFYESIRKMHIRENQNFNSDFWCLESKGETYLFYLKNTKAFEVDLSNYNGKFEVYWINASTGNLMLKNDIQGRQKHNLTALQANSEPSVVYIKKK